VQSDEELVGEARARLPTPLSRRDRLTSAALGGSFLATAVAIAVLLPGHRTLAVLPAALLVVCYGVVSRVEFELGPGSAVPTQLVLVPMLFVLPVSFVPLAVAAGYMVGALLDGLDRRRHPQRALALLSYSWHSVGPACVLALFGHDELRWDDWPVYAAALGAQFAFDFASSAAREKLAFGVSPRDLLPFLRWVYTVDALLAPVALLVASVSRGRPVAFVVVLPLVALLALLARDRTRRIDRALELSEAYEGASRVARSDPLTGLGNRLAWDEAMAAVQAGAADGPFSVIMLDLDGLKLANDTRGHAFGDRLLRSLGEVVRESVRAHDQVARLGGDELGVLMTATDEAGCDEIAARIADAIAAHPVVDGFRLSAAVGHSTCAAGAAVAHAVRSADTRMYVQKRARAAQVLELDDLAGRRLARTEARLERRTRAAGVGDEDEPALPEELLEQSGR
jgi:diguanylate cyclase (GGDEF)-like protein